jgi:hypothetical protein
MKVSRYGKCQMFKCICRNQELWLNWLSWGCHKKGSPRVTSAVEDKLISYQPQKSAIYCSPIYFFRVQVTDTSQTFQRKLNLSFMVELLQWNHYHWVCFAGDTDLVTIHDTLNQRGFYSDTPSHLVCTWGLSFVRQQDNDQKHQAV